MKPKKAPVAVWPPQPAAPPKKSTADRIVDRVEQFLGDVIDADMSPEDQSEECWSLCIDAARDMGLEDEAAQSAAKEACRILGYERGVNESLSVGQKVVTRTGLVGVVRKIKGENATVAIHNRLCTYRVGTLKPKGKAEVEESVSRKLIEAAVPGAEQVKLTRPFIGIPAGTTGQVVKRHETQGKVLVKFTVKESPSWVPLSALTRAGDSDASEDQERNDLEARRDGPHGRGRNASCE